MIYTVYILFSTKYNKIYIGYTSDLINRFRSHNELSTKDWTRSFRPWTVIYCEYFENKTQAEKREKQLKSTNRIHIRLRRTRVQLPIPLQIKALKQRAFFMTYIVYIFLLGMLFISAVLRYQKGGSGKSHLLYTSIYEKTVFTWFDHLFSYSSNKPQEMSKEGYQLIS